MRKSGENYAYHPLRRTRSFQLRGAVEHAVFEHVSLKLAQPSSGYIALFQNICLPRGTPREENNIRILSMKYSTTQLRLMRWRARHCRPQMTPAFQFGLARNVRHLLCFKLSVVPRKSAYTRRCKRFSNRTSLDILRAKMRVQTHALTSSQH